MNRRYNNFHGSLTVQKEVSVKSKQKHLTLSDRILIEQGLNEGKSFKAIASSIGKDPTTVSKEVKKHRAIKYHKDKTKKPYCANEKTCFIHGLCSQQRCFKLCKNCKLCRDLCPQYKPKECGRLHKAPFVCNSCKSIVSCQYYRWVYVAKFADDSYRELLSASREGINQSAEDMQELDRLISPLILKGQSISHIYMSHSNEIGCSRRTLYKYIDQSVFTARNIDLPRKVKYKLRKSTGTRKPVNRAYRNDRRYVEFCTLLKDNPDTQVVEMDIVEGQKGGKVLLTLLFRNCNLMLAFLLEEKTQEKVLGIFNFLTERLGISTFKKLFPVILTDNGAEFQNPWELECDQSGEIRTKIYYCDPNCSWQKGMIEKNHEYIRYVIPSGKSFDSFSKEDILLLVNHINSTARDSLNSCTPYQLSRMLLDNSLHTELSLQAIQPDDVILKPALLKH